MTPEKKCKWVNKISSKDKDMFEDPSVPFKPVPPPFKTQTVKQFTSPLQNTTTSAATTKPTSIEHT